MKRVRLASLAALTFSLVLAQDSLNNDSVLKMVKSGLGENLIISMIHAQPGKYSLNPDELVKLKGAGVSENVLAAMADKSANLGSAPSPAKVAKSTKISDGAVVPLLTTEPLSSQTNHSNDPVHLEVAEDVKAGDVIVIAKGAPAVGHVVDASKKGAFGKDGILTMTVEYVQAVDGKNVRLRATAGRDSKQGAIRPSMVLGAVGALHKGKDVNLPKGTTVSAYVDGDKDVGLP